MRRKKQLLSDDESIEVLKRGKTGVLALIGDNGYPYAVPVNYVYDDSKIYLHGAKAGHKIDAVKRCSKVSFCVIDKDDIIPEEYTTYFRSVIVFGKICILEDEKEVKQAVEKLAVKYYPQDSKVGREQEIDKGWANLCMLTISIEHMTGKAAIEIVRKKCDFC